MDPVALERQFSAPNYHPLPVVLTRGEGAYLWDIDGRRYVDMMSAYSAVSHGHGHPRILAALEAQARRLAVPSRAYHNDRLGPFLEKLSKPITVFAEIALESHGRQDQFERRLAAIEEVVECWEVSGAYDYLARVVCADVARYEALTAELIEDPKLGVARIVSIIALRPVRRFAGYPVSLLSRKPG